MRDNFKVFLVPLFLFAYIRDNSVVTLKEWLQFSITFTFAASDLDKFSGVFFVFSISFICRRVGN